jgi:hypothetical protein
LDQSFGSTRFSPGLCLRLAQFELISTNSRIKFEYELCCFEYELCCFAPSSTTTNPAFNSAEQQRTGLNQDQASGAYIYSAERCNFLMPPRRRLAAEKQHKIPKKRAIWREVVGLHFYPSIALPFFFLFISTVAIAFLIILG